MSDLNIQKMCTRRGGRTHDPRIRSPMLWPTELDGRIDNDNKNISNYQILIEIILRIC
jgi:hypothetical protein